MEMREQSLEQDQILNAEQTKVQNVSEENVTIEDSQVEQPQEEVAKTSLSKEELLAALTELSQKEATDIGRDEVSRLKQQFYAIRKNEIEKEKAEFIANGNEEAAFAATTDELEEKFKEALNVIKAKKAVLLAAQEAERQNNFEQKAKILDEIKTLAADTENVNRTFNRFKELQ